MQNTDIAIPHASLVPTATALAVEDVAGQVDLIQHVMKRVMKKGEHYGVIPGCGDKPTLLKPGAEKLAMTFRFAPKYEIQERDMGHGHREYRVVCALQSILTGQFAGEGVGVGTTMEGKWRFRQEVVPGVAVTKEYWETRDPELLGGSNRKPQKRDGKWVVVERVEHDNPADYYNTVLKMAKKRAMVDAVLTATAASDIFTQDVEDMPQAESGPAQTSPPQHATQPAQTGQQATQKQVGFLQNVARDAGFDEQGLLDAARRFLKANDFNDLSQLFSKEASTLIDAIKSGKLKPAPATSRMDEMPEDEGGMDPTVASFLDAESAREAANV